MAQADKVNTSRPMVELFIKAAVDKMKAGGCPLCQRYFMALYVLREQGIIDLTVTTFLPESPPDEILKFSNGKRYPLVKVHSGVDAKGRDLTGEECDTIDDIEHLLDRFACDEMHGRRESTLEDRAEKAFEDLYKKFNAFLRFGETDTQPLLKLLLKLDNYLKNSGTKFMVSQRLARADCYLLPILQHLRVAGKAYKDFEISTELNNVWRYLANSYQTDAFLESCPADREIITHYDGKASCEAKLPTNYRKSQLMGEERTLSVPSHIRVSNGNAY